MKIIYWFCVVLSLILIGCQDDPPAVVADNPGIQESKYFEDYDVPYLKWGYIDQKGKKVIEAIYDDNREFSEGQAAVNFEGRWGYIDRQGRNVIPHEYLEAHEFKNGLALVKSFEGEWKFINKDASSSFPVKGQQITDMEMGYALANTNFTWTCLDENGKTLFTGEYDKIKKLTESKVLVKSDGKVGVLDLSGNIVQPIEFDKIYFEDTGIVVYRKDGMYSIANGFDEKPKPTDFTKVYPFHTEIGLAKKDSFLLINADGKVLKQLSYDKVKYGGQDFWLYKQSGKWGILDKLGNKITDPKFTFMNRFVEDRIVFGESDRRWGFLDTKGNEIVPARLPLLWDYKNGVARVIDRNGIGFVDLNGELVINPQFIDVKDFSEGLARFQIM